MNCSTRALKRFSILTILVVGAVAASQVAAAEGSESPLRGGAWAAEFEIDPDLTGGFGYTGSATIAVKRHTSPSFAFRFGAVMGYDEQELDGRRQGGFSEYQDRIDERHDYALLLHAVHEWEVRERVGMFLEAGPTVRYGQLSENLDLRSPSGSGQILHLGEVRRGAGLDANVGFEWFFGKRVSLGARYGLSAAYEWGRNIASNENWVAGSLTSVDQLRTDIDRVTVTFNRAALTLAAYF